MIAYPEAAPASASDSTPPRRRQAGCDRPPYGERECVNIASASCRTASLWLRAPQYNARSTIARIQHAPSTPRRSKTLIGAPVAADVAVGLRLMRQFRDHADGGSVRCNTLAPGAGKARHDCLHWVR